MKNKLVKKLLAAVLAATLVAGMLVGCGKPTTTNTPTTGTPTKGADPTKVRILQILPLLRMLPRKQL